MQADRRQMNVALKRFPEDSRYHPAFLCAKSNGKETLSKAENEDEVSQLGWSREKSESSLRNGWNVELGEELFKKRYKNTFLYLK